MKLFNNRWFIVFVHVAIWIVYLYSPYFFRPSNNEFVRAEEARRRTPRDSAFNRTADSQFHFPPPNREQKPDAARRDLFNKFNIALDAIWVAVFYLNVFFLMPRLIYRKKYFSYVAVLLGIIVLLLLIHLIFFNTIGFKFPWGRGGPPFPFVFFKFITILVCSASYRIITDKITEDKKAKEKENENLKTELSLLRSQVSPHFMFNVLNSMVYMARMKNDNLEPSLIKLSSLMRYMLYDADEDKVPLQSEIEYLESYIDLQKQRFEDSVQVKVKVNVDSMNHYIEPMLLIPFVENAFKHGTGMIENAIIDILLSVKKDELEFIVSNKYNPLLNEVKDKVSGIGLANVKRRLNLLYGKTHSIKIEEDNGRFIVSLHLKLV